jgi:methylated-DNA-protein-cysteine methyltransferase-like protein
MNQSAEKKFSIIYGIVSEIPRGKVATYGQIAALAEMPGAARLVGYALRSLPDGTKVPWHRVINSQGMISLLPDPIIMEVQKQLLIAEGISFDEKQKISFSEYLWSFLN